jgi:hypothetical protein
MTRIRKENNMKSRSFTQRGQALILIALAGIALFGIAGLAIDGSAKFSDRRHAQNAADTAALAGALTLARNGTASACSTSSGYSNSAACLDIIYAAWDRAQENGYDGTLKSDVEVYSPPISGTFSDCNDVHFDCKDYVQVIVTSYVDTWFMRVLGINQSTNTVQAVASKLAGYTGHLFGGNAVVALAPDGCSLVAGGSSDTTVIGGGLLSNSASDKCSFKQAGCDGQVTITDSGGGQGPIVTVGGMQVNSNCMDNLDASLQMATVKQQPFPPQVVLPEPAVCSASKGTPSKSGNTATYEPGHYTNISTGGSIDNIVLKPGIYCVDGQISLSNSGSPSKPADTIKVQGTYGANPGVFIYIKPGGSQNPISLQGGDIVLWADTDPTGAYANYLIYVAPDMLTGKITNCTINGGSGQQMRGSIYAPFCNLKINGSSTSGFESQLIGYTVDLSGTADVNINYDDSFSPTVTIPLQVGLSR